MIFGFLVILDSVLPKYYHDPYSILLSSIPFVRKFRRKSVENAELVAFGITGVMRAKVKRIFLGEDRGEAVRFEVKARGELKFFILYEECSCSCHEKGRLISQSVHPRTRDREHQ